MREKRERRDVVLKRRRREIWRWMDGFRRWGIIPEKGRRRGKRKEKKKIKILFYYYYIGPIFDQLQTVPKKLQKIENIILRRNMKMV